MRLGLTLLACLLVWSCGGPPSVFDTDHESPLLQAPPLGDAAGGGVWIGPIAGAPEPAGDDFRKALAKALIARDVAAGLESAGPLSARLSAAAAPATHAGRGYVDVWWRLEGADGALWDAFSAATPLDFRVERPETRATIDQIALRLEAFLSPPQAAEAAPEAPLRIAVPPAETDGFEDGAPLARAMAAALAARGFQPVPAETAEALVIARASAKPATPGNVEIEIRWSVETPDGEEIGAADQKNVLPEALLEDGLAAIAADAAGAAADAIADLANIARQRSKAAQETSGASTDEGAT